MSGKKLAIQSYCFRGFKDNAEVAQKVKAIGLDAIEVCGVHVNFDDESTHAKAIATYKKAGVAIVSIGVQRFADRPEVEEKYFRFCQAAGIKLMGVDFDVAAAPKAYRTAERLADKYDVNLAIHNHGGRHWLGSSQMLSAVFKQTSPRIGLMLDTAWMLDSHEDPVAVAERFADRLYGLHLKDFVFDRAGKPEDVVVGTGNLDLPKLYQTLAAKGFTGEEILEYEGDVNNPVPALSKCVEAVQKERVRHG